MELLGEKAVFLQQGREAGIGSHELGESALRLKGITEGSEAESWLH
jgi:hypothetical protein